MIATDSSGWLSNLSPISRIIGFLSSEVLPVLVGRIRCLNFCLRQIWRFCLFSHPPSLTSHSTPTGLTQFRVHRVSSTPDVKSNSSSTHSDILLFYHSQQPRPFSHHFLSSCLYFNMRNVSLVPIKSSKLNDIHPQKKHSTEIACI